MASKSRLGKGLGALFPTLPGEEPVAEQPAMIAEDSSTPEATADITPAKKATAQQESKPAVPQTISSSKAVKKAAGKRASMPALLILATCFSVRRNLKPVRSPHLSRAASRLRLRRHIVHPSLSKMFHVKHL
jgi:hypothetical protein